MSNSFRNQLKEAFKKFNERYWYRQRLILRPMLCDGKLETPAIRSSFITELLQMDEGESEIYIEDLINEHRELKGRDIEQSFRTNRYTKTVPTWINEYAKMKKYKVIFYEGDVLFNPKYNPAKGRYEG
ncbi:MAG: hypothetical protein KC478_10885 [Bacteriovoracaceae bacterium]|nr:hypothetical protein [Bacteriovoracaceae bacterium]